MTRGCISPRHFPDIGVVNYRPLCYDATAVSFDLLLLKTLPPVTWPLHPLTVCCFCLTLCVSVYPPVCLSDWLCPRAAVSLQEIHMRKAFRSQVVKDQAVFSRESMPAAMRETYLSCDRPPPLDQLNCFRWERLTGVIGTSSAPLPPHTHTLPALHR